MLAEQKMLVKERMLNVQRIAKYNPLFLKLKNLQANNNKWARILFDGSIKIQNQKLMGRYQNFNNKINEGLCFVSALPIINGNSGTGWFQWVYQNPILTGLYAGGVIASCALFMHGVGYTQAQRPDRGHRNPTLEEFVNAPICTLPPPPKTWGPLPSSGTWGEGFIKVKREPKFRFNQWEAWDRYQIPIPIKSGDSSIFQILRMPKDTPLFPHTQKIFLHKIQSLKIFKFDANLIFYSRHNLNKKREAGEFPSHFTFVDFIKIEIKIHEEAKLQVRRDPLFREGFIEFMSRRNPNMPVEEISALVNEVASKY